MGSIKSVKTDNFKFDVESVTDGIAQVRVSALISSDAKPKHGDILFRFDGLSRNKTNAVQVANLWAYVTEFEERLALLMTMRKSA